MGSLPLTWNDTLARSARDWVRFRLAYTYRTSQQWPVEVCEVICEDSKYNLL